MGTTSSSERLQQADSQLRGLNLADARALYTRLLTDFQKTGELRKAERCRAGLATIDIYETDYPYAERQLRALLARSFPSVTARLRNKWIETGKLEHVTIDGKRRYFKNVIDNIKYRDLKLFRHDQRLSHSFDSVVQLFMSKYVRQGGAGGAEGYSDPTTVYGTETIDIPRDKLPSNGNLKVWIPEPILSGSQQRASVTSISPANSVRNEGTGNIGMTYMEQPLEELRESLSIKVDFTETHYEQNFTVDPSKVGRYDRKNPEYERFTRSFGNTTVTPGITKTARKVVGGEKNPYLAARKLYYYVLDNVKYSMMPDGFWVHGPKASAYVEENRFGDDTAQSIYFSALCRSLGIPARSTVGWQILNGGFEDHVWAEFLVPNYGWLPADTSMAQLADYDSDLSKEQKKAYKDYFFGNQDNLRCVLQEDADLPVKPSIEAGLLYKPVVIQAPQAVCDTMGPVPSRLVQEYWKVRVSTPPPPMPSGPRAPAIVYHGDRSKPRIALTFDDGYSGMGQLLDLLTELKVPATIFPTGGADSVHPELIRKARNLGFEIGNHTYTHPKCTRIPSDALAREIISTDNQVRMACGTGTVAYFRPPYGDVDARVEQVAAQLGYITVMWGSDTRDWSSLTTPEQLFARATSVQNGDIVLMHTQGRYTMSVLPRIVSELRARGFELTTVSGVLDQR